MIYSSVLRAAATAAVTTTLLVLSACAESDPATRARSPEPKLAVGSSSVAARAAAAGSGGSALGASSAGSAEASRASNTVAAGDREPEARNTELRRLTVPGFEPALLSSPPGPGIYPLIVAAHGAGGSPEWECEYWRQLSHGRAFILCLSGTPLGTNVGFYFRDHHALEREFAAAESVARAADPRIAAGSGLYAGFSQGSTMGTAMIGKHGQAFPYLVLIEGFQLWNVPGAKQYARAGGKRALLACGSKECAKVANASIRWLKLGGVEARVEFQPGAGHTPLGGVMERVAAALPWLLAGDELWQ